MQLPPNVELFPRRPEFRMVGEASRMALLRRHLGAVSTAAGEDDLVVLPMLDDRGRPAPEATVAALEGRAAHRVLLVSSTEIYAPLYSQPGLVAEKPAASLRGRHAIADAWCRFELEMVAHLEAAGARWRILRPAPTPHAGGRDPWSRLWGRAFALLPMGFGPPLQLLHEEDLAAALQEALGAFDQLPAVVNVVPPDAVPLRRALRLAGVRRIPVPFSCLWLVDRMKKSLGLGASEPSELDRFRYTFTASGSAFADHGYTARRNAAAAAARGRPDVVPREGESHDPFGLDRPAIERLRRTIFRFFHDFYWRVDLRGLQHVPPGGPVILLGVHRGLAPFDAMMALHAIAGAGGRVPRFLIHPALLRFPFIGDLMRRLGGLVACRENADWVLARGQILGLFPEGVRGAFAPYREAYRIHRFGRAEFVRLALRHRAPMALFVTLGSAEVFPILATRDWKWWKSWSGWPCFPITPTPLPLPVKWHTLFLPPISIDPHPPSDAENRRTVKKLSTQVHRRLEATLLSMRDRRPSWFWGRLRGGEESEPWRHPETENDPADR